MTMKISTGLAKGLLDTGSLRDVMQGMVLRIYGGAIPSSADSAVAPAVLLCEITVDDTGDPLNFEAAAVANVIEKSSAEDWRGEVVSTGNPTFCRLVLQSDDDSWSTTAPRIQGEVGAGRFLYLDGSLTAGAIQSVDSLVIAMPLQ